MQKFHTDDVHYPDLGSASDWLEFVSTNQKHYLDLGSGRRQYGISALVTQTSFCKGSSGNLAKRRLLSQAKGNMLLQECFCNSVSSFAGAFMTTLLLHLHSPVAQTKAQSFSI